MTIILTIILQLILLGIIDSHRSTTKSKKTHAIQMWIIFICILPIMYYFAGMITNLTWDDFTIVDESYQHGIMLRNVLLPVIPVCIMLLWYTLFCDIKAKIFRINLCILYLFGVTLMLIHLAFPSVL